MTGSYASAGVELVIPVSERSQTYAFDRYWDRLRK
jgi:hypothetical protein